MMQRKTKKPLPPPPAPKNELSQEARGFMLLASSALLLLSLFSFSFAPHEGNWIGLIGHRISLLLHAVFGIGSYFVVLYVGWVGWHFLFRKEIENFWQKVGVFCLMIVSFNILLSLLEDLYPRFSALLGKFLYNASYKQNLRYHLGGAPFYYLYQDLPGYNLHRIMNQMGVALFFSSTLIFSWLYFAKVPLSHLINKIVAKWQERKEVWEDEEEILPLEEIAYVEPIKREFKPRPTLTQKKEESEISISIPKPALITEAPKEPLLTKRAKALKAQAVWNGDFGSYSLPPLSLVSDVKKVDQTLLRKDLKRQAEVLEETLLSFGIEAKVGQINCGPTITSFEVHPSIGVKVQKIKALENDIALNLEAKSIRIIAPIPGKAAVGIEVPNTTPQDVGFKEILAYYQQKGMGLQIPVLLGKGVAGEFLMSDLAKMPHCLIAGATGSGKSVCINTVVMSILFSARPDEIKLMMVDPKKVELTQYSHLPHMIAPVITEPLGAAAALNWLVKEMEKRYEILKNLGVRNVQAFNSRKRNEEFEQSLDMEIPEKMFYIVAIIDEFADLMMISQHDIETPIARIAQMARAVGIHLILATQRPSREVITGLIKANFPTRISFKMASRVNSQIVLDEVGAESLMGNGDMLFLPPRSSSLIRGQGAYIGDEDIMRVIQFIKEQAPPNYLIPSFDEVDEEDALVATGKEKGGDSLFDKAKEIVQSAGNASTTFLQRKLKIGYARAASLIDQLEEEGIIGPPDGNKIRKLLSTRDEPL